MKQIPLKLQTHLKQAATTTCLLIVIRTRDYRVFGFTTLDENIEFQFPFADQTVYCYASNGVTPSRLQSAADFGIDNTDLSGVTSLGNWSGWSSRLTDAHILAGALDYAEVSIYRVNYLNLNQGAELVMMGTCGQTEINGRQFRC